MAVWRKGCPRCNGDVFQEMTLDGQSLSCLQCGYSLNARQEAVLRERRRLVQAAPHRPVAA